ncbi:MAG: hypothetical protein D6E12_14755 [Desulfovibrio sp.]|nr:MAG: hypothetical protein D6E12_14755 [Desulfovibrio sp.]
MIVYTSDGNRYVLNLTCPEIRSITIDGGSASVSCGDSPASSGTYIDDWGTTVTTPCGEDSFADQVMEFHVGHPSPPERHWSPERALGPPDFTYDYSNILVLGCGGVVTLAWNNAFLIDVPGDDLHIFEANMDRVQDVEPVQVSVSPNGWHWYNVGYIQAGKSSIDIGPYVRPGELFRYVRLVDMRGDCDTNYPGAEIDAVAAIGCRRR